MSYLSHGTALFWIFYGSVNSGNSFRENSIASTENDMCYEVILSIPLLKSFLLYNCSKDVPVKLFEGKFATIWDRYRFSFKQALLLILFYTVDTSKASISYQWFYSFSGANRMGSRRRSRFHFGRDVSTTWIGLACCKMH